MSNLKTFIRDAFDGAWNAHDADHVLRLFAKDAVIQTEPPMPGAPPRFEGRDQIRQFVQTLMPGFHVESSNFEVDGDTVTWFSTVACDAFRQLGLDTLDCWAKAVVRRGQITSFTPAFTPGSVAQMQAAQHKALMRRLYEEVINTGNLDLADQFIAVDCIDHEEFPGVTSGLEGFKQLFMQFRTAFPDLHVEVEDMVAQGDRVVSRVTMRGTHQGAFLGMPPTGNPIRLTAIDIIRFADGKAVEHWANSDTLGLMQQLGAIPAAGAAPQHAGDGALAEAALDSAALVRAIYDAFNRRDFDYTVRLATDDTVLTNMPTGQRFQGPEGVRQFLNGWATAFSDAQVEVLDVIADGNRVAIEFIGRGTHTGPLQTPAGPVSPTGRPIEIPFCDVWQMQDDQIITGHTYFDVMTMLHQLGVLPAPTPA